jgi:hypothetical protein
MKERYFNGWRYVFGLPCMAYRVTTTANGKLKYTACYALVAVNLPLNFNRRTKNIFILLCGGKIIILIISYLENN